MSNRIRVGRIFILVFFLLAPLLFARENGAGADAADGGEDFYGEEFPDFGSAPGVTLTGTP